MRYKWVDYTKNDKETQFYHISARTSNFPFFQTAT